MIKHISIFIIVVLMLITTSACGKNAVFNNVEYETYGFINKSEVKDSHIRYKIVWGNVFLGIVFFETIIAPLYFFGYDLYEPIGVKN